MAEQAAPPMLGSQSRSGSTVSLGKGFQGRSVSDPGMVLPNAPAASADDCAVALRVFGCNAVTAPGVLHKAVMVTPNMTSREVIARVLEKYECPEDPSKFELQYARIVEEKTKRKFSLSRKGAQRDERVLEDDMCPVLFADWFSDHPRRFELHRKSHQLTKRKGSRLGLFTATKSRDALQIPSNLVTDLSAPTTAIGSVSEIEATQPAFLMNVSEGAEKSAHALAEGATLVGSDPSADYVIHQPGVTGFHFEVVMVGSDIALFPLASSQVFVDGTQIMRPNLLYNNAVIEFGAERKQRIRLSHPSNKATSVQPLPSKLTLAFYQAVSERDQKRLALSKSYREDLQSALDMSGAIATADDYDDELSDDELDFSDTAALSCVEIAELRESPTQAFGRFLLSPISEYVPLASTPAPKAGKPSRDFGTEAVPVLAFQQMDHVGESETDGPMVQSVHGVEESVLAPASDQARSFTAADAMANAMRRASAALEAETAA